MDVAFSGCTPGLPPLMIKTSVLPDWVPPEGKSAVYEVMGAPSWESNGALNEVPTVPFNRRPVIGSHSQPNFGFLVLPKPS